MQYQTKTNSRSTEYHLVDIILRMECFLSYKRMCFLDTDVMYRGKVVVEAYNDVTHSTTK